MSFQENLFRQIDATSILHDATTVFYLLGTVAVLKVKFRRLLA